MKHGRLSGQRRTKFGYGLRLTDIRGKLPERMPDAETWKARSDFRIHFHDHVDKILYFLLIYGQHIKKFFLKADISPSERKEERQVTFFF